jgi:hypothetical protein
MESSYVVPLELDDFLGWLADTLALASVPTPDDRLADLTEGDTLVQFNIAMAFDKLTAGDASPIPALFLATSARELYLHYLEVLARPMDGKDG